MGDATAVANSTITTWLTETLVSGGLTHKALASQIYSIQRSLYQDYLRIGNWGHASTAY